MEGLGNLISLVALAISLISAYVAYQAKREQRNASRNSAAYTYMAMAERLLESHPELYQLHNIDQAMIDRCGVTPAALLYLTQSFVSADLYHRIENYEGVWLSEYRKNLLSNEKVQQVWESIIDGRLISPSPFTAEVNRCISEVKKLTAK